MNAMWTLEVWSTPGGWRLVDVFTKLRSARIMRDTAYYSIVKTRIRRWEPSK